MGKLIDIIMPATEEEGTESVMESWFKKAGDYVEKHEPILEINTDKVTMELPAPASGVLKEILKEPNDPVAAGDILGRIEIAAVEVDAAPAATGGQEPQRRRQGESGGRDAAVTGLSPAVRRLLKQHDLDPQQITGSGRGGRVTAEDVENYLKQAESSGTVADSAAMPGRKVPHTPLRRRTASHMVESMLKTAPHVTAIFDADMSAVIAHREHHKTEFQQQNVNLTFTAYFVAASVAALQAVPEVNSRWHDDALEIFEDCNIGIAVATEQGLIVPVIHRAQRLGLPGIAEKLHDITNRAREGRLEKADLQQGTFTVTNHGMTGSLIATPIIHQPQSAILGIGKLEKRVVVVEKNGKDTTEIKPMVYVTLTIDHRALDGFQANRFLSEFVAALQKW